MHRLTWLVTALLAWPACADLEQEPGALPRSDAPRGIYVWEEPAPGESERYTGLEAMSPKPRIIYMNRWGGTFHPGHTDSVEDTSSIPGFTAEIEPWDVSDEGWQEVMDCMKAIWSPFNVLITDGDPGEVDHIESVVAGHPRDVGLGVGIGGVSPFNCNIIERSVVFTFAEVYGENYKSVCETASQEVAHSFALDHEVLCRDPMSYLDCGPKSFQDTEAPCGEWEERPCNCERPAQNSFELLLAANGPADVAPPSLSFLEPTDGSVVDPGFTVELHAEDASGIERLEVFVDNAPLGTIDGPPWRVDTDATLANGRHEIAARAADVQKNTAIETITVRVDGGPDHQSPASGGCAASGAGASGGALLLLAALLAPIRRRRPRRRPRPGRRARPPARGRARGADRGAGSPSARTS